MAHNYNYNNKGCLWPIIEIFHNRIGFIMMKMINMMIIIPTFGYMNIITKSHNTNHQSQIINHSIL